MMNSYNKVELGTDLTNDNVNELADTNIPDCIISTKDRIKSTYTRMELE